MAADHLTSQLKELCKFLSAGNEESDKRLIETLNPLSVVDVDPYKNFSILFVFYTYFNFAEIYFIAIFFDKENRPSIL